jgi:hypothetical protein
MKTAAACFRAEGYRVDTGPLEEPPDARDSFTVSKGNRLALTLFFHESAKTAKERQRETESMVSQPPVLQGTFHRERRGNVAISWFSDNPGFEATRADFRVLDRCVSSG